MRRIAALLLAASMLLGGAQAETADKVPKFDIPGACRAMVVQADVAHGQNQTENIKHCIETEDQARQQLEEGWSRFTATARTTCLGVSSVGSVKPVYSELMACLERMRRSRREPGSP
jgi:hypothetical protein